MITHETLNTDYSKNNKEITDNICSLLININHSMIFWFSTPSLNFFKSVSIFVFAHRI